MNKQRTKEIRDVIAKRLGWMDYDHMMLNEGEIDLTLQKALNWICEFYNIEHVFKGV